MQDVEKNIPYCPLCGGATSQAWQSKCPSCGVSTYSAGTALLEVSTNVDSIKALAARLMRAGAFETAELDSVIHAFLRRETISTTGVGCGIAIPHIEHQAVDEPVGMIATTRRGIDFGSFDGEPVRLIVMLITPPQRTCDRLRALAAISRRLLRDACHQREIIAS